MHQGGQGRARNSCYVGYAWGSGLLHQGRGACLCCAGPPPLGTMPPTELMQGIPIVSSAGPVSLPHTVPVTTVAPVSLPNVTTPSSVPAGSLLANRGPDYSGAALMCNLLPTIGQSKDASLSAGIYVGEGLLPVPAKLAKKITRWEFVEMAELLPEFWSTPSPKEPSSSSTMRQSASRRRRVVTDIATWIQCFATYTSMMSTTHPKAVPELLAYLIFILCASQDFGGVAWVTYDAAFRRQAFITGNQQWSKVNPSLYSICFSGVARTGVRCELCLSLSHPTRECILVCDPDPDVASRLKTLESAVLAFTSKVPPRYAAQSGGYKSPDICRNWNAGRCRLPQYRYIHACRVCGGPNPAFACCDRPLGQRQSSNLHTPGQASSGEPRGHQGQLYNRQPGPGPTTHMSRSHPGMLLY